MKFIWPRLENKGIKATVPEPGTVTVTENFSNGRRIYQGGFRSARIQDTNGLPTFEVTGSGDITVFHDGTIRRAWISFFLIVLVPGALVPGVSTYERSGRRRLYEVGRCLPGTDSDVRIRLGMLAEKHYIERNLQRISVRVSHY